MKHLPGVSRVQITFHEDKDPAQHAMPPGGFRQFLEPRGGFAGREIVRTHLLAKAA